MFQLFLALLTLHSVEQGKASSRRRLRQNFRPSIPSGESVEHVALDRILKICSRYAMLFDMAESIRHHLKMIARVVVLVAVVVMVVGFVGLL